MTAEYRRGLEDAAKAMCGLCEDGAPVVEVLKFIGEGSTFLHERDGPRHRCAAGAIRALIKMYDQQAKP